MKKHFLTAALLVVVMATIVLVAIVQTMPTDDDESPSFDDYMVDSDYVLEMNLDDSEYTEELASEWLKNLSDIYLPAMPIMSKVSWLIETKMADDNEEWKVFDEVEAELAISDFKTEAESLVKDLVQLRWLITTGQFTDDTKKKIGKVQLITSMFSQKKMKELSRFNWREFKNASLKRSFHRAIILMGDSGIQDIDNLYKLKEIKNNMVKTFSTAKVRINNTLVPLDPNIVAIFESSRNYNELSHVWQLWRDASGKKYERDYPSYVKLSNEATSEYGFRDYGEYVRSSFEVEDLNADFDLVYTEIGKLYKLLHAYTKRELSRIYRKELDPNKSVLPAHVLGDLWAQQWHNIFEDIKPYKNKLLLDITPKMRAKNMTVHQMVKVAEEFFQSLGMEPLPQKFWDHSIFEKPKDNREINCHAAAWDFLNGEDYRIKMCSEVTMNDLFIMHHEMGHIYYYMHYKNQPFQFKEGANPGFHEAIGDLMTLSVMTPSHLHKIGLLDKFEEDEGEFYFKF